MSTPTTALPAGAALGFSYEYGLDVDLNYDAGAATPTEPNWQPVRRASAIAPTAPPITATAQSYDDLGAPNDQKTSESWALAFTALVNRLASGLYAPEIEALKKYTEPDAIGTASIAHVRWYDKPASGAPNPNDAYEGFCSVSFDRGNTGNADTGSWSFSLTGQGRRIQIANPFTGWVPSTPVVTSVLPSGAAAGDLVTIKGSGFSTVTGLDGVKFGAANAADYEIVSPTAIVASLPTGSAGAANVVVKSPAGSSAPFTYTRGA